MERSGNESPSPLIESRSPEALILSLEAVIGGESVKRGLGEGSPSLRGARREFGGGTG